MSGKKRIKVLILPKWYPNRFDVLDGIFVVEHAKSAAIENDVFVLFVHNDPELPERKKTTISEQNGCIEHIVYFRQRKTGFAPIDKLTIGFQYLTTQFQAYRLLKREWGTPDIVHVHVLVRSAFLALWLKLIKGIPFVVTEHWSGFDQSVGYKIGWLKKQLLRFTLKKSSAVTTVSEYLKSHVAKFCPGKEIIVIPNAVNAEQFKPIKKTASQKKRLIHVSTLDDYPKNFGNILRAVAEIAKVRSDFELHIIGKGVEREKQERLASELGILNHFLIFHGYLPKNEVAKKMAESDLFILFSHYETQSCVVIESLLSGVPVIAPKLGGVQELISEKNGILVPPNNSEKFCAAVISVLDGKIAFDAEEIRRDALRYGAAEVGRKFSAIYTSLVI